MSKVTEMMGGNDTPYPRFVEMIQEIERVLPPSRERALCITKLDEAAMWLDAAISMENDGGDDAS